MALTKPQKNKIIMGVIGLVLLAAGLLIKKFLTKNETANKDQSASIVSANFDSSSQKIILPNQQNSNTGDVVNKVVEKEYNYYTDTAKVPSKAAYKSKNEPKELLPPIVNKGNLSVGQKGGVVYQNTTIQSEPDPRHLSKEDKKLIDSKLSSLNISRIQMWFHEPDTEGLSYLDEIYSYIDPSKYNIQTIQIGNMPPAVQIIKDLVPRTVKEIVLSQ